MIYLATSYDESPIVLVKVNLVPPEKPCNTLCASLSVQVTWNSVCTGRQPGIVLPVFTGKVKCWHQVGSRNIHAASIYIYICSYLNASLVKSDSLCACLGGCAHV